MVCILFCHCVLIVYYVVAVVKVVSPFTGNGEKREKCVSYIKPARKQIIIFTNVIKRIINYYDTDIYYLMYAGRVKCENRTPFTVYSSPHYCTQEGRIC